MMVRNNAYVIEYTHDDIQGLIECWEPPAKPHCSNCRFAKVAPPVTAPTVSCAMGHGDVIPLGAMLRRKFPRQFKPAVRCEDFSSMGPADGGVS